MFTSTRKLFRRAPDSPTEGTITLTDDSERVLFDTGDVSDLAHRVQTALLSVTLNSHSSVTVRLRASINGDIVTVSDVSYNAAKINDLFGDINPDRVTSRRVRITIEGANANPSTPGEVDFSISHTQAR